MTYKEFLEKLEEVEEPFMVKKFNLEDNVVEDTVNEVVENGTISINDTCSSNIGTPPSVGQSV